MPESINVTDPYTGRSAVVQYEGIKTKEKHDTERNARLSNYNRFWAYYSGEQYDEDNRKKRGELSLKADQRLPEHLRKHSYSGVIADGVDFITDQLMNDLGIEIVTDKEIETGEKEDKIPEEQTIFQDIWDSSDMELEGPDLTREAIVSGESYILLKWDEAEKKVRFIPYDAESVNPVYSDDNYKKMIMADIIQTSFNEEEKRDIKITERYVLGVTSEGYLECVYLKFDDQDENPEEARLLNIPFIPIIHLRAIRKRVRQSYGESLVKDLIGDADRYNAVNQLEFLIARYNSTSHLAIFGTEGQIKPEKLLLGGEVNDFWGFPNTTEGKVITLPTDPTMLQNQKDTIENQMYKKMGLQRMDLADFKGFGAPSGYSLEIINRRTDGVFSRIRKELAKGYTEAYDRAMDMQAIMESGKEWYNIKTKDKYPNRNVKFSFGTVFVADLEQIRQDYVAGIMSRKRALMARGYSEQEAITISEEVDEENAKKNEGELEGVGALLKTKK